MTTTFRTASTGGLQAGREEPRGRTVPCQHAKAGAQQQLGGCWRCGGCWLGGGGACFGAAGSAACPAGNTRPAGASWRRSRRRSARRRRSGYASRWVLPVRALPFTRGTSAVAGLRLSRMLEGGGARVVGRTCTLAKATIPLTALHVHPWTRGTSTPGDSPAAHTPLRVCCGRGTANTSMQGASLLHSCWRSGTRAGKRTPWVMVAQALRSLTFQRWRPCSPRPPAPLPQHTRRRRSRGRRSRSSKRRRKEMGTQT